MDKNIDWGFILTAGGFVVGIVGLFLAGNKITQNISPKTKNGNINMSNSEFVIKKEVNRYKDSKDKRKD